MMHTTKMLLVPSQMVNKETGSENLMSSLDKEMQRILADKSLPADAKVAQYTQILHRYQKTGEEHKKPFKIEVQEPSVPTKVSDPNEIIKSIPPKFVKQAKALLQYVKSNSHITWSDDNELVVDGVKFPGSNIQELIDDFSRGRKKHLPVKGAAAFARALAKANIPKSAIGNKYRHELFEDQEPLVFATPPTTSQPSQRKTKKGKRQKRNRIASSPMSFNSNWDSV